MPELPEVETVCRGLASALEGRKIARAVVRRDGLRAPFPPGLSERLAGRRVLKVGRRAKFILIHLDNDDVMVAHLGMSGCFRVFEGPPPHPGKHDHVVIDFNGPVSVHFHDPRRFGLIDMVDGGKMESYARLSGLGPEPLGPDFDADYLGHSLSRRKGPIKVAIMDQSIVAGMGNIYASESLFRAAISPRRKASTVPGVRAVRLVAAIRDVLEEAIAAGGSSLRDHRQVSGEMGYFQQTLAVYGQTGKACPGCNCELEKTKGVRHIQQSGRSTFYCPRRQR